MKKMTISLGAALAALMSGCSVYVPAPGVAVEAPGVAVAVEPAPVVEVVPTAYVWDGVEYVGEYNGGYYYYGPSGVWIGCDAVVLGRFHGWEGYHPDWRDHAFRNEGSYRLDRAHYGGRGRDYRPGPGGRPSGGPSHGGPRPEVQRGRNAPSPQHGPAQHARPQHRPEEEKKDH